MIVIATHKINREFDHNNGFGIHVPLVEPEVNVIVSFDKNSRPAILNTVIGIRGVYNNAEFIYEDEENIEVTPEGESFSVDELLNEVRNSINRCFKDAYDACVHHSLTFPFARIYPNIDLAQTRTQLEQDLS